jgi:hypothetical protein
MADAATALQKEAQPDSHKPTPADWLDRSTKAGALFFGVIYVVGFLVVNLYYSQYGVTDFSLLKAKILAAGALYAVLATVSIIVAMRLTGKFGLLSPLAAFATHPGPLEWFWPATILNLWATAFLFGSATDFLFVDAGRPEFALKGTFLAGGIVFAFLVAVVFARKRNYWHTKTFLTITFIAFVGINFGFGLADWNRIFRVGWFKAWGLATIWAIRNERNEKFWKGVPWERSLFSFF